MALPTITFNSSGSSDTAASGAGPATALFGTAAALASSTTVTLSIDGPDLSGVDLTGLAVLWVDSTSGRQYSRITAVDNVAKTVTVATAYGVTEATRNWGIGGKRATFEHADSRTLFADAEAGWIIVTEVDQSITTSAITISQTGGITIKGDSTTTKRVISTNANAAIFSVTGIATNDIQNLAFENTNGTKTSANAFTLSVSARLRVRNCRMGHATNTILQGFARSANSPIIMLFDCEILNCTSNGMGGTNVDCEVYGSYIHDCTTNGISSAGGNVRIDNSIIETNGADGVNLGANGVLLRCSNSVIHGNTGDGIDTSGAAARIANAIIFNNNFTANVGAGINAAAASNPAFLDYNNFGTGATANTGGSMLNLTAGANDLAVDPGYADAANGNFAAGTAIKAEGFPDAARKIGGNPTNGTVAFVDIGIQRQEAGGGGITSPDQRIGQESVHSI